jgi:hypothetical protein
VHIAQTNLNGPAFNPLWSDAPGRWQVDGKVGDMNETLARAVALGAEMPVEVMAADAPEPRMVPVLRSDTEAAQRALQMMSDFIQDCNRDLFLDASLYSGWVIAERLRRGGA